MDNGKVVFFYPSCEGAGQYYWFPFMYLYLAPFLEKGGFSVRIVDSRVEPGWRDILKNSLPGALCLGITAMTGSDIKSALEAAAIARRTNPRLTIIWGGPHASALPEQTTESDSVDIVVRGPGEKAMLEIAKRLSSKRDLHGICGITYKEDQLIYQAPNSTAFSFDYNFFPALHLIDIEKYRSPNNVASIFTARGCPYKCTFCTTGEKGYSERTFEQVKEEIKTIVIKNKFRNLFFQDGTFFCNKKRVMKISAWLIETGLNIRWKAKARANSLINYTKRELSLLKESGLVSLFFGVESGSQRILNKMRKHTKPQDAQKSAGICRDYGIEFYASFMFAVPGEEIADLNLTIAHIRELKKINPKCIIQNCIYIPLPDTLMYEDARKCGYSPPRKLEGWINRNISSRFEERADINWIPKETLKIYSKIYNDEFGDYKHLCEKEKEGTYTSVFKKQ